MSLGSLLYLLFPGLLVLFKVDAKVSLDLTEELAVDGDVTFAVTMVAMDIKFFEIFGVCVYLLTHLLEDTILLMVLSLEQLYKVNLV